MKDYHYLFILPNCFKAVGLIIAAVAAIASVVLDMNPLMPRTVLSVFILGLLLFVLAKEKREDEMIVRARYVSVMPCVGGRDFHCHCPASAYALDEISLGGGCAGACVGGSVYLHR